MGLSPSYKQDPVGTNAGIAQSAQGPQGNVYMYGIQSSLLEGLAAFATGIPCNIPECAGATGEHVPDPSCKQDLSADAGIPRSCPVHKVADGEHAQSLTSHCQRDLAGARHGNYLECS